MRTNKIQGRTVQGYIKRFPKSKDRTLARKIYKENKPLWASYQSCYGLVRYYKGTHGKKSRENIRNTTHLESPVEIPIEPLDKLPNPFSEYDTPFCPVEIVGAYKAAILSDIHIPYHDLTALKTSINHAKKVGCDMIILNGDTADNHSISRFEKDPRTRMFKKEIEMIREQFLPTLRETFPKARIIWKDGNHDERYFKYLCDHAEDLLGLPELEWKTLLRLNNFGIEYVGDKRPIMLGRLPVIHGHEYKTSFAAPVNPARGYFLRAKTFCLGSHHHQSSAHDEKDLIGKVISTWSTGCLCGLNPRFMPLNNHNHGFAVVETTTNGDFVVSNRKIINGVIY
jgi:predicted phosphodiesterase